MTVGAIQAQEQQVMWGGLQTRAVKLPQRVTIQKNLRDDFPLLLIS